MFQWSNHYWWNLSIYFETEGFVVPRYPPTLLQNRASYVMYVCGGLYEVFRDLIKLTIMSLLTWTIRTQTQREKGKVQMIKRMEINQIKPATNDPQALSSSPPPPGLTPSMSLGLVAIMSCCWLFRSSWSILSPII